MEQNTVSYTPQSIHGELTNLRIDSSDPKTKTFLIQLSGTGTQNGSVPSGNGLTPQIQVSVLHPEGRAVIQPGSTEHFGNFPVGMGEVGMFYQIGNHGQAQLKVNEVKFVSTTTRFSFRNLPPLPLTLEPGQEFKFMVYYSTLALQPQDHVDVQVTSNDSAHGTFPFRLTGVVHPMGQ